MAKITQVHPFKPVLSFFFTFFDRSNVSISGENYTSATQETIVTDTDTADGIAYDWVHGNLYWTDTGRNTIALLTMIGRHRKTILKKNLDEPRGIAVDPRDGQKWIYWTDWGKKAKIGKSGLDGSKPSLVVTTNIGWPNDVTIDYMENRLYWIDAKLHLISSCDLDGQNRRQILSDEVVLNFPFSIDVFGDMMYWSEWDSVSIYQANKYNGSFVENIYMSSTFFPMGLKVYHPSKQPHGKFL